MNTARDLAGMAMAALYILGPLKPAWRAYKWWEGRGK